MEFSKDELPLYLPKLILQDISGNELSPMKTPTNASEFGSPQIPPLESRLHYYMLGARSQEKARHFLTLGDIFNTEEIEEEIASEIQRLGADVKLFDECQKENVFEKLEREVQELLKK